jgi:alkanesulfonate monooxygenase SsuD/methylene tetrahydromethanopterin reductase-like flavin-dependent oxidoreductase (luciferase family)
MRYALHVPTFADPGELVEMGVAAEGAGWDGFFLWDHVFGGPSFPVPIVDPWVVLGGLATKTEHIKLGTVVTALARRRPQKVARETVTLDHLSGGRLVLGVGLGNPPEDEYAAFGEDADPPTIAARLDEALEVVAGLWGSDTYDHEGRFFTVRGAQFLPVPLQQPRIPVWVASQPSHRRPLQRAAGWDGVVLASMGQEGADQLEASDVMEALRVIETHRGSLEAFDVAVVSDGLPAEGVGDAYAEVGVTWVLVTGWISQLQDLVRLRSPAHV